MAHSRRTYPAWIYRRRWAERADSPAYRPVLWFAPRDGCPRCFSREEQSREARRIARGGFDCRVQQSAYWKRASSAQDLGRRTNWRERQADRHSAHREIGVVDLTSRIATGLVLWQGCCNYNIPANSFARG